MADVEELMEDPRLLIELLKTQPHTYRTLIGDKYSWYGTLYPKVRKKLNRLSSIGLIMKTTIPGTRFGMVLFYNEPRDYTILVEATRFGPAVYYFRESKRLSNNYFEVVELWKFDSDEWKKEPTPKTFFSGHILKMF